MVVIPKFWYKLENRAVMECLFRFLIQQQKVFMYLLHTWTAEMEQASTMWYTLGAIIVVKTIGNLRVGASPKCTSCGTRRVEPAAEARTNLDVYSKSEVQGLVDINTFPWGNQTDIGNAQWWLNLKNSLSNMSSKTRKSFLGMTKKVKLNNTISDTNAATMIYIGVDQDTPCSLTFQTRGVLPSGLLFGNARWDYSNTRGICQEFYTYCSAHDAIKSVVKDTCLTTENNNNRNCSVSYRTETVWIPSELEMGLDTLSPLSVANRSTSKAECTQGKCFSYEYYVDNTSRIKYLMDRNGNLDNTCECIWLRSRDYRFDLSTYVCVINSNGISSYQNGSGSTGFFVAPAFVIG